MMLLTQFVLVLVFAPHRGLLAKFLLRRRQRWIFAEQMLVVHLHSHEGHADQGIESAAATVHEHLHWDTNFAREIVRRARQRGWIEQIGDALALTERGRQAALQAVAYRN
jgi:manganese/zinc/iron transport system permease protein